MSKLDIGCLFCYILLFILTITVAYYVVGWCVIKLVISLL